MTKYNASTRTAHFCMTNRPTGHVCKHCPKTAIYPHKPGKSASDILCANVRIESKPLAAGGTRRRQRRRP